MIMMKAKRSEGFRHGLFFLLVGVLTAQSDPLLSSWYTERSGVYARVFQNDAAIPNGATTTWVHPGGGASQTTPTYAGVHELSYTDDWLYLRTTGLGSYTMGPWYADETRTSFFPSFPSNSNGFPGSQLYRIPRFPVDPTTVTTHTLTEDGAIGYFVNGVAMFDTRDSFSYQSPPGRDVPNGAERWNRDAYVNELLTFDASLAHQIRGFYHYHCNPSALRYQLGDSTDFDEPNNTYSENFNGQHSPILGWTREGLPVYGPYAYSDPLGPDSGVRRMITGYQSRSGLTTRDTWPAWATRFYAEAGVSFLPGPDVSATYPLGRYMEDNDYKGDLGMALGVDFDLNEYNTRWCVTPEFPDGTWAYFTCIDESGVPAYPYNISRAYFGEPLGGAPDGLPDTDEAGAPVTTIFQGGPEKADTINSVSVDTLINDEITIVWSGVEGATYVVEESADLGAAAPWTPVAPAAVAQGDTLRAEDTGALGADRSNFYRVARTDLASFDSSGFDFTNPFAGPFTTVTVTLTGNTGQTAPPNLSILPISLTFDGMTIDLATVSRPSQQEITFDADLSDLGPGTFNIVATFRGATGIQLSNYTIVPAVQHNILLLIVDDWGTDSSPFDNNPTLSPGTTFPTMANLQSLAAQGVRFRNGYAQPVCSPTRAALLTGRQAWRTGVGSPGDILQASEITLPRAFADAGSPYALASYGKWHLGGTGGGMDILGWSNTGGWPEFIGITGGGAGDYFSWRKNDNGTITADFTTYSTTDQVTEARTFIDARELAGNPWFVWMGFNAPHTPFHEPPADLLQGGTGTSNRELYNKALEALDTEIGRLLQSVDLNTTNVIIVGDNGTPAQVVQAPYGPVGPSGHSKSDPYEGGVHVPFIALGPDVTLPAGSTSDRLVHVVDLFPTILALAGVPYPGTGIDATSILPILNGTDTARRCAVTETFNDTNFPAARSIRMETDPLFPGSDPDYKLIIFGDPTTTTDTPTFELYNLINDPNENSPLNLAALNPSQQAAYDALIAKDNALGGGYSEPFGGPSTADIVYLEIRNPSVPAPPRRVNLAPDSVTINGTATGVTYVSRSSFGTVLSDEGDDAADVYWIKCTVDPSNAPYTSAVIDFPDAPGGNPRIFNALNIYLIP